MPPHVRALVSTIDADEKKREQEQEIRRRQLDLDIYFSEDEAVNATSKELAIDRNCTVQQATEGAWKLWGLDKKGIALEDVRLRK